MGESLCSLAVVVVEQAAQTLTTNDLTVNLAYVFTKPPLVQTSTVVKSIAAKTSQCALIKVIQDVRRFRSGAGSIPCSISAFRPRDLMAGI